MLKRFNVLATILCALTWMHPALPVSQITKPDRDDFAFFKSKFIDFFFNVPQLLLLNYLDMLQIWLNCSALSLRYFDDIHEGILLQKLSRTELQIQNIHYKHFTRQHSYIRTPRVLENILID
jgi:hypothetical protein